MNFVYKVSDVHCIVIILCHMIITPSDIRIEETVYQLPFEPLTIILSQPVVVCCANLQRLHPDRKLKLDKDTMQGTSLLAALTVYSHVM